MEITDWLKKEWTGSGATFRFSFFSLPLIDFIFISIFFFFFSGVIHLIGLAS